MPQPERHTDDYDHAIAMLEWTVGDTVPVDPDAFAQLVLDRWDWSGRWHATMSNYSSR
jgi:hypothetical protein